MFSAFKERKPWASALIGLLTSPTIIMLYLNRGRTGFYYFLLSLMLMALPFALAHVFGFDPAPLFNAVTLGLNVVGAVHGYRVARRQPFISPLWYARWYNLVFLFTALPITLALAFRMYAYEPFHIPTGSMTPTINKGDYVYVNKRYRAKDIHRGDVVVFHSLQKPSVAFVKRIMGLPGEHIQLKGGVVYINGTALARHQIEDYLPDMENSHPVQQVIETLPEGREIRVIQLNLESPADNTPEYVIPAGNYFVMGDNRDNSRDSRFMQDMGFIPEGMIVGKASVIWWNSTTYKFSYKPIE